MKFYVYILFSDKDKKLYIGFTQNLKNRFSDHTNGRVHSTKNRRPLKLVHYEYFVSKVDAQKREIFLKSGFGRNELKKCLKDTFLKFGYTHKNTL